MDKWQVRNDFSISWRIFWYCGVFALVAFLITTAAFIMQPTWLGFERKAFINSHQYIEGKRAQLSYLSLQVATVDSDIAKQRMNLSDDPEKDVKVRKLITSLQNHKEALVFEMRRVASHLPPNEVPRSARQYLD